MNDISGRTWYLDQPVPYVASATLPNPTVIYPYEVKVAHFEYVGYSAQGNVAIIKDRNGKVVCKLTGAADLEEVRSGKVGWVSGMCLDTCQGNGAVLVNLEP